MSAARQAFESITVDRARELILETAPKPTETITLPLAQAVGFVTSCEIAAANPLPDLHQFGHGRLCVSL